MKPLIASGLVVEGAVKNSPGTGRTLGRPPVSLSFNGTRDLFVGANLGVRLSQVGVAALTGDILAEEEFETPERPLDAMRMLRESIQRLCGSVAGERELRVIGVGVPGPIDAERRKLLFAPHLGWKDIDVANGLRFNSRGAIRLAGEGVPVIVENNATAAALYEARLRLRGGGSGSLNNFVVVRSGYREGRGNCRRIRPYDDCGWW
jgi:predicted NBD/HSP70 family sugar kinase